MCTKHMKKHCQPPMTLGLLPPWTIMKNVYMIQKKKMYHLISHNCITAVSDKQELLWGL